MLNQVYKIDENGYFLENVLINEKDDLPDDCIEIQPMGKFYLPKWNGQEWVEGLSEEEIKRIQEEANKPQPPTIEEQIQQLREEKKMADLALLELVELILGGIEGGE